jgi:2-dehydro-3-deoxyphosphogluconate aldolase/(4S)-4-hydroxy-2-oxoglutarate aldolase
VFPDIRLCPTGGVNAHNMRDYLKAGAAFVGVGNNIVDAQALAAGDRARVVAHAKQFLEP